MSLLIKNVRPWGKDSVDILIEDGFIARLEPNIQISNTPDSTIDAKNQLALPGLINAHAHLDKNLLGLPWHKNQVPGPRIRDFVDFERKFRQQNQISAETQSAKQIEASIKLGITHIRTHIDIDTEAGLKHFEGVMANKERYKHQMKLQTVAFPQSGMLIRPGTVELLEEAVKQGADCIGGLDPSIIDRDPVTHLDTIFDIADRHQVELDIHLHEPGELGAFSVELIIERCKTLSLQGKVTISHCFCLGQIDEGHLNSLIDGLLENQIAVMSLGSGTGNFPPLKKLYEAGVTLCSGTDGIRDTWGPHNSPDMLNRVQMLAYRSGFRKDEDIEMLLDIVTHSSAKVMKDADYGLSVGKQADLVILPGDTPAHAVVEQGNQRLVIKKGVIVADRAQLII